VKRKNIQPVVQVLAEFALLDRPLQIPVARRHEARPAMVGLVAPHRLELAGVDHA
jgi:hypothetical protein